MRVVSAVSPYFYFRPEVGAVEAIAEQLGVDGAIEVHYMDNPGLEAISGKIIGFGATKEAAESDYRGRVAAERTRLIADGAKIMAQLQAMEDE